MKKESKMRIFKLKQKWALLFLVALSIVGAGIMSTSYAQEKEAETKSKSVTTKSVEKQDSPAPIIPVAEKKESTVFENIDSVFAKGVDYIATVLFYKFFKSDQQSVVVEKVEQYTRDKGSKDSFKIYVQKEKSSPKIITNKELTLLSYKDRILKGSSGSSIQVGEINKKPVEFISLKLEYKDIPFQSKYILDSEDKKYHQLLPKRDLLSKEKTLTDEEVEQLGVAGWLKINKKSTSGKSWIFKDKVGGAPFVVLWLAGGAIFFTIYMGGYNLWGFKHAVEVVSGKYDNPEEDGEVTHFQALASALSATVGLGNIAGVTIAMVLGGPGAFFWMIMCGLFGMTSKFVECTLGQKYRKVNPDGTILGGPMRYLQAGLAEIGLRDLGIILSLVFAVMCILASFGGGNMFQANQSGTVVLSTLQQSTTQELKDLNKSIRSAAENNNAEEIEKLQAQKEILTEEKQQFEKNFRQGYGVVLAFLVAIVIIGGIKRIAKAAEKVVPTMCGVYVIACLWIILNHIAQVPALIGTILTEAFTGEALGGGILGVMIIGIQRAAFSNEAGVGSAAIAHSAAKTDEPVREGSVALLGPFIDTIVVCSMTALVILITNAWNNDEWILTEKLAGADLTARAFSQEIPGFEWILSIAVFLFAYSTIISWSYYGERCWEYIFGRKSIFLYKILTIVCVFVGAIVNLGSVLDFSDMMILSMAVPNILGVVLLTPIVKKDLTAYWKRYKNGEFKTFK
jgi:alanine or glycine:cation symporter, AGCS family